MKRTFTLDENDLKRIISSYLYTAKGADLKKADIAIKVNGNILDKRTVEAVCTSRDIEIEYDGV